MRIGAFSRRTNVSVKMMRHYDSINLLKPAQVDAFTGYRMYTEDQENFVRWVGILRNLGFTLAEIKAMLTGEIRDQRLIGFLKRKRSSITDGLNEQIQKKIQIDTLIRILENEGFSMDKKMKLTDLNQMDIHEIKKNMPNMEMFLDNILAMDTRRDSKPMVFLHLDLWHFKSVNDEYGFEVGDDRSLARCEAPRAELHIGQSVEQQVFLICLGREGNKEFLGGSNEVPLNAVRASLSARQMDKPCPFCSNRVRCV